MGCSHPTQERNVPVTTDYCNYHSEDRLLENLCRTKDWRIDRSNVKLAVGRGCNLNHNAVIGTKASIL